MFEKVPHHTPKSWASYTSRQRDYIEEQRKKAQIARRKTALVPPGPGHTSTQNGDIGTAPIPPPDIPLEPTLPTPPASNPGIHPHGTREFNAITSFLAAGGADNRSDEEVWSTMAEIHPYFSSEEWRGYWDTHGEAINEVVKTLITSLPSSQPGANGTM